MKYSDCSPVKKDFSVQIYAAKIMGIHLLLIGKTGTGKSSTGNTILGKPNRFKACDSMDSVTTDIQSDYCDFDGRTLKVTDGPGLGDTTMNDDDAFKMVTDKMKHALDTHRQGYNVFLLVVRFGGRFTEEDVQTIRMLKKIFGIDFVKNHCVLLMTGGDNFDPEEEECTFDDWCVKQTGVFKELLEECENRAVLFDNKTKDEGTKNAQMDRLIKMLDALVYKKHRYTKEEFDEAHKRRLLEMDCADMQHEHMDTLNGLTEDFKRFQTYQPESQIQPLKLLKQRADKLYQDVCVSEDGPETLKTFLFIQDNVSALTKQIMDLQINHGLQALKENDRVKLLKYN